MTFFGGSFMDGFQKRTLKKKQHIINTAQNLFKRTGVSDANILDIAKEASVSHVTIYHYFNNKDGLIDAVMDDTLDKISMKAVEILDRAKTFEEGLDLILEYESNRYEGYHDNFKQALIAHEKNKMHRENNDILDSLRRFMELSKTSNRPVRKFSKETILVFVYLFRYLKSHGFLDITHVKQEITEFFKYGILDYT